MGVKRSLLIWSWRRMSGTAKRWSESTGERWDIRVTQLCQSLMTAPKHLTFKRLITRAVLAKPKTTGRLVSQWYAGISGHDKCTCGHIALLHIVTLHRGKAVRVECIKCHTECRFILAESHATS